MRNGSPGNPRGKPTTRAAKRKTAKRKTTKRKTAKPKATKRKTAKRKTTKRKTAKRKTAKRKTAKRKATKRKTAKRIDSRPPGVSLDSGESSSSKDSDISVLARRFLQYRAA